MARVRIVGPGPRTALAVLLAVLLAGLLAGLVPTGAAAAAERHHRAREPVTPCSRGLVALTFDDGPSATVTPRLVRKLTGLGVPATFFMVGRRVAATPEVARRVEAAGFTIGNHTWNHTDLTTQTADEQRLALRLARHAIVEAGLTPGHLMRPPYGAIDDATRRVVGGAGYVPVLWTIDSRDWTGLTPDQITARILAGVRPHATNIVLQHDGVTNSPASVRAVPDVVTRLRRRGFCFAALGADGLPTPPVPVATVSHAPRRILEGARAEITVRLDRPTSRPTSIRVDVHDVTTSPGDYGWTSKRVRFPVGETLAKVRLPIRRDGLDEARERLELRLSYGRGTTAPVGSLARITLIDRDDPPVLTVSGGEVTASNVIEVAAPVTVRLARPSGRDVRVRIRTHRETAGPADYRPVDEWVTVPAGARVAELAVIVLPGPVGERVETIRLDVLAVRRAVLAGSGTTRLTIRPAAAWVPPRLNPAGPDWS